MQINGVKIFDLEGSSYIYVKGNGTEQENADELINAYNFAKTATPYGNALADNNRFTVIVGAGVYSTSDGSQVYFDTDYINVVSLTAQPDVLIKFGVRVGLRYYCDFVGIDCFTLSNKSFSVEVGGYLNFTNCKAGDNSFGNTDSQFYRLNNCNFNNCSAGSYSFASQLQSCNFENCIGQDYCFGVSNNIFTDIGSNNNTFINCKARGNSFFYYAGASRIAIQDNKFINCYAYELSFISCQQAYQHAIERNTFELCKNEAYNDDYGSFIYLLSENIILDSVINNNIFYDCFSLTIKSFIYIDLISYSVGRNKFYNCIGQQNNFITADFTNSTGYSPILHRFTENVLEGCISAKKSFFYYYNDQSNFGQDVVIEKNQISNCISDGNSFIYCEFGVADRWDLFINENYIDSCNCKADGETNYSFLVVLYPNSLEMTLNRVSNCFSQVEFSYIYTNKTGTSGKWDISDNTIDTCKSTVGNSFGYFVHNTNSLPKINRNKFIGCDGSAGNFNFGIVDGVNDDFFFGAGLLFINCIARESCFVNTPTIGATIKYDAYSNNCISDSKSYGNTDVQGGLINYCNLLKATFNYVGGNQIRLCIDINQDIINS